MSVRRVSRDTDIPLALGGLNRIGEEVQENAPELVLVDPDQRQRVRDMERQAHRPFMEAPSELPFDPRQILHRVRLLGRHARDAQHGEIVGDDVVKPVGFQR